MRWSPAGCIASPRLRAWFEALRDAKKTKVFGDPELFSTYVALTADAREVVAAHVEAMVGQIARILADGIAEGAFVTDDPAATARAVWDMTARFHNPVHSAEWADPDTDAAFDRVFALLLAGLAARPPHAPA